MHSLYIKSVVAKGEGKRDSLIEFSPKLTIICGASNTGKTYIFKIINYLFGSKTLDIKANTGYTDFEMTISLNNNDIIFARKINSTNIVVNSSTPLINSDTYSIDLDSPKPINKVYLRLLGIDDEFAVPYNKNCEMKRFTLRAFLHILMIHEKEIERDLSILLPKETLNRTYFLSHLLYLIYEQDFSSYDADEKDNIKIAKKTAVENYINRKISEVKERIDTIKEDHILLQENIDANETINHLTAELHIIQNKINQAIKNGKRILDTINDSNESLTECDILLNRYNSLESQYLSDIKRLSFIVESTTLLQNNQSKNICPFCNNHSEEIIPETNIDAVNGEIIRIQKQLNDINESKADILMEKENAISNISKLKNDYKDLEYEINSSLKKQELDIKMQLDAFYKYIKLSSELDSLLTMTATWNNDLTNLNKKKEHKTVYKPLELFSPLFEKDITDIIRNILKSCNLPKYETAHFSLKSFDIEINGNKKNANGKGMSAFFNTVLVLAFRKYLYDKAIIKPFFFIIDTPLLGLDVGKAELNEKNIRKGIYQYFIDSIEQSQLIILDNEKDLPKINLDVEKNRVHYFSHTKDNKSRYGFLLDFED